MSSHGSARKNGAHIYLVGGGIASLAAAAFLIRDGDIPGQNITILEQLDRLGGSLDGAGSPESDDRKQVPLHVLAVFVDSNFGRQQDRNSGNIRME